MDVIAAYKRGDRLGAPWETGEVYLTDRSLREIYAREIAGMDGTDESDIVNCFLNFSEGYPFADVDEMLLDWCVYHQRNHRVRGYGRTFKKHFELVKFLIKEGRLSLETIRKMSRERDSFGNACLALVYPVFCYAHAIGQDPFELVRSFTLLTHAHEKALAATNMLARIVDSPDSVASIAGDLGLINLPVERLIREFPTNIPADMTMVYALRCALECEQDKIVQMAVNLNGDVDSVLATAMLISTLPLSE